MRRAPAALLRHAPINGPAHLDLVIGYGRRCPTAQLTYEHGRLRWRWALPHRRFYLDFSGPVSAGRGVVRRRWYGWARFSHHTVQFGPWRLTRLPVVPTPALRTLFQP